MKTVYFLATSLDGFIADSDHGVGWLDQLKIDFRNDVAEAFFHSVDALIMGRKTYDFVYNYGRWPYVDAPTWVCSSREVPVMKGCNLQKQRDPLGAIKEASKRGYQKIWIVGGSRLAASLIEMQLLTHIDISVMPAILGNGIRLIDVLPEPIFMRQINSSSTSGFTQIEYQIEYEDSE